MLFAVRLPLFPPALFFLPCFRPILPACSGAGPVGAGMVKVPRYHTGLLAVFPGRALFQGTPHQLGCMQGLGWVCAHFRASSFHAGHRALALPIVCSQQLSQCSSLPPVFTDTTSRAVSSAPVLLKVHFHAQNSIPAV